MLQRELWELWLDTWEAKFDNLCMNEWVLGQGLCLLPQVALVVCSHSSSSEAFGRKAATTREFPNKHWQMVPEE